ncbi:MAG TPA: tyrosine-type recombinase/integrase [Candidatus Acidoferrum sp.]|nr:tyrosine-type recombinase/integrase [Candidatus Acidoferrum sp.]
MREGLAYNLELVRRYKLWLIAQHYALSTQNYYLRVLKQFCMFLNTRPLTAATHNDVLQFLADEATRGLRLHAIHNELNTLRCFYDFLNVGGIVTQAPARLVRLRPARREIPRILSEEEVERLIASAGSLRDKVLLELLYSTGCRMGEIASLRVEDIDFHARTIRVVGKSQARIVLFGRSAEKAIRDYIGERRSGYLFISDWPPQWGSVLQQRGSWIGKWMDYTDPQKPKVKQIALGRVASMSYEYARNLLSSRIRQEHHVRPERGKPPDGVTLLSAIKKAAHRAGIGNVSARMLRHTFATHLLDHGADIRVIQELMGHAWIQTTQLYTQVSRKRLAETFRTCHPRGA